MSKSEQLQKQIDDLSAWARLNIETGSTVDYFLQAGLGRLDQAVEQLQDGEALTTIIRD